MKCRENRNRRKRNRRRNIRTRIYAHLHRTLPLDGCARPYYEPHPIMWRRRGRKFDVRYGIRQTQAYRDLIAELIERCGDMTVDLSALKPEPAGATA